MGHTYNTDSLLDTIGVPVVLAFLLVRSAVQAGIWKCDGPWGLRTNPAHILAGTSVPRASEHFAVLSSTWGVGYGLIDTVRTP